MPKIRIITDRLPQPDRAIGAILDVSAEKAATLVAQGFAVVLDKDEAQPVKVRAQRRSVAL